MNERIWLNALCLKVIKRSLCLNHKRIGQTGPKRKLKKKTLKLNFDLIDMTLGKKITFSYPIIFINLFYCDLNYNNRRYSLC